MTGLSPSQEAAVRHITGPAMVLAGPGSGKTHVVTNRVRYLIEEVGVDPRRILVITFTRAAAAQMRERFAALCPGKDYRVTFGTFHGVFFQILRRAYHFRAENILPEGERKRILQELMQRERLFEEESRELLPGLSGEISLIKNEQIPLEHFYSGVCAGDVFRRIFAGYQRALRERGLMDYDDILVETRRLLMEREDIRAQWQRQFTYLLIDEFQDINRLQYESLKMLAAPENNLFAVGDDDQSIYRFRGAKPELMLSFPEEYPGARILALGENYRSRQEITETANRVIRGNVRRFSKEAAPVRGRGGKTVSLQVKTPLEESLYIVREIRAAKERGLSWREIAVLTRTNTGGRQIAERLMEYEIPFTLRDGMPNLYDHWIAADLLTYLRLGLGSRQRGDFLRVMNKPLRYLSRDCFDTPTVSFDRLRMYYEDKRWMVQRLDQWEEQLDALGRMKPFAAVNFIRFGMDYERYLREYALKHRIDPEELSQVAGELQEQASSFDSFQAWSDHIDRYRQELEKQRREQKRNDAPSADAVLIGTLHSAKGLEFDTVFLPDLNEGTLPYQRASREADLEEERRLFYVGITRAKNTLYLLHVKERYGKIQEPSRFLDQL